MLSDTYFTCKTFSAIITVRSCEESRLNKQRKECKRCKLFKQWQDETAQLASDIEEALINDYSETPTE